MATLQLEAVNQLNDKSPFQLSSPPTTDIVGVPAMVAVASPFQFASPVTKISLPSKEFKRARMTITWSSDTCDWDQAGLLLVRPPPGLPEPSATNPGDANNLVRIGRTASFEIMKHGQHLAAISINTTGGKEEKALIGTMPWAFADVQDDEPNIWVGFYISRPDFKKEKDNTHFEATFCNFKGESVDGTVRFS
ncbi:hypothetical protein DL98DRAFT_630517 [Cadophora sp. DSE1049]|nr:hypothetical protein DL98DRAFT_630517 [Cadophora sp. DSE1049]